MRQAFAGMLWSKQFFHYDVERWLDGDPAGPPAARGPQDGPQRRVAPPEQRRRHLHARQVGVPLVRGVGPGLPLRRPRLRRRRLRQGPAAPHVPRVVHAPQRPAAGLRVELRRRQPARPRVGRPAGLRDRRLAPTSTSSSASSTSCSSTSPGGSTARTPPATTSSRAASSASTTSAPSTARPPCPSTAGSSSPTARRGWPCTASTCWRSPWCWPSTTSPTRTWPPSSSSTSPTSPPPSTTGACGTRRTASTTTSSPSRPASGCRCGCGRWSACCPCAPPRRSARARSTASRTSPATSAGSRPTSRRFVENVVHAHRLGEHEGRLLSIVGPERLTRILSTMLDADEFLSPHGLRAVAASRTGSDRSRR